MAIRIAVDAMGGDHAPAVVVEGVVQAVEAASAPMEVLLASPPAEVAPLLEALAPAVRARIEVLPAGSVIAMGEAPASAVKGKPDSSIHVGLQAVKSGRADAFVSAGNTGAVMAVALLLLGRLPGVARPTLVGFFPTTKGACLVLDVGSNVDCRPEHLVQFGQMGSIYARAVMGFEAPSVALMNIGEEPGKGNEQVKAAHALMQQAAGLHFVGNIEGRDLFHHGADVVICDGFVGNVMLKLGESMATVLPVLVQQEMSRLGLDGPSQQLVGRVLQGVRKRFDYTEYGGAPLLGIDGTVLIGHGSSNARAVARLVEVAAEVVQQQVTETIAQDLGRPAPV